MWRLTADELVPLARRRRPSVPFWAVRATFLLFAPGTLEQLDNLLVGGLIEVPVPEAYGHEIRGRFQADQPIDLFAEGLARVRSAHGHGEDEVPGIPSAKSLYCRPGPHAGGDAIVQ